MVCENKQRSAFLLFANCHFERPVPASVMAELQLERAFAAAAAAAAAGMVEDSAGWDRALRPCQMELWPTERKWWQNDRKRGGEGAADTYTQQIFLALPLTFCLMTIFVIAHLWKIAFLLDWIVKNKSFLRQTQKLENK